ncbi:hypothetical protein ACFW2V_14015 [Streptomyces sp. NPDC058947]|uniref:hypothetical protein n=1 Tax=Streptomyces sp. NPDC058947 TaxID=3346675 RepID=UPI0036C2ED27
MNGKQGWVGIPPSPKVFEQLDQEEVSVLALLAWSSATNRPVTSRDLAALPDRNGTALGAIEAKHITKTLSELKIASVLGMNNDRPLSVFLGGFQPASTARRPVPPRLDYPKAVADQVIENKSGGLPALRTTSLTPAFVPKEAKLLREAQAKVDSGAFGDDRVGAAIERKRILEARIDLYQRWLTLERSHPVLAKFLERKRKALPELRFQLERARMPGGSKREQKRRAEQAEAGE